MLELAYDDPTGVTAAFNKNLLARINRELGGDFDLRAFDFTASYDAAARCVDSFLVARARAERARSTRSDATSRSPPASRSTPSRRTSSDRRPDRARERDGLPLRAGLDRSGRALPRLPARSRLTRARVRAPARQRPRDGRSGRHHDTLSQRPRFRARRSRADVCARGSRLRRRSVLLRERSRDARGATASTAAACSSAAVRHRSRALRRRALAERRCARSGARRVRARARATVRERRIPMLAICRGLQVVNVAFGGSLIEDLPSDFGEGYTLHHQQVADGRPRTRRLHAGARRPLEPASAFARLAGGDCFPTNSLHHQAVRVLAPGLDAVGPDAGRHDRSARAGVRASVLFLRAVASRDPRRYGSCQREPLRRVRACRRAALYPGGLASALKRPARRSAAFSPARNSKSAAIASAAKRYAAGRELRAASSLRRPSKSKHAEAAGVDPGGEVCDRDQRDGGDPHAADDDRQRLRQLDAPEALRGVIPSPRAASRSAAGRSANPAAMLRTRIICA